MKKLILLLLIFTIVFPTTAYAEATYFVVAKDNTTLGYNAYGTNGSTYIMSAPAITREHISSLYVRPDGNGTYFYAETGYCVHDGYEDCPWIFASWARYGQPYDIHYYSELPGTNHSFTVRHLSGTNNWRFYKDGIEIDTVDLASFRTGWSTSSSERYESGDTNYSHFWGLTKRNSTGTWYNWADMQLYKDNDPDYWFNEISNTEWYSQR